MYEEVLKVILKVMKSEYGTFGYFDEQGAFVAPAVTRKIYWNKCNVPEKDIIFQKGTFGGIWGKAIRERKSLIDNYGPFNTPKGHISIENTIAIPIIFRDEVISAIHLANKPNGYDEEDRERLETIVFQIAPVLKARLQRDKQDKKRKQAEEMLRESEGRFRQFMDNFPGIAFISDPGRCVTYANKAYSDFYKLNLEELINHKFEEYVSPESLAKAKEQDKIVVSENRPLEIEETVPDKTGSREWYTCKFPIHRQNKPVLIGGLGIEITDRKRSEEALKKFKAILDNANYGMAISDLEGNLEYVNEYFAGIHGYSSDELIGRNLAIFHNEEQLKMVAEVNKELIERGDYALEEIWHSHKDGFSFPMLMSGMVIKGENKDQHRLAVTAIDITGLKKLQAQLVRTERLAATGQLAASIAHEINSPLQAITFILNALKERSGHDKELSDKMDLLKGAFANIRDTVKEPARPESPGDG